MQCRICGYNFDEKVVPQGCKGCGKKECQTIHCPNCGFGNSPEFETEFDIITSLKKKIRLNKK
ncbi:MAG: hypothetical protein FWH29_02210 [Methanobrevibacter sp.]|nr:hypothetical protein [Methanobrevibacter sp.]